MAAPFGDVLFKDRGSKFIGYIYPVATEEDVKQHLNSLKKTQHAARHWCYAWRLGIDKVHYRANDDGEPNNSAGQPIYGQLLAEDLTNTLIVVVRYFGGTKLGVGGLVNAYRTTAKWTIEQAKLIYKTIEIKIQLVFEYKDMDKVRRIIKEEGLEICKELLELDCDYIISVRRAKVAGVIARFEDLRCLSSIRIIP